MSYTTDLDEAGKNWDMGKGNLMNDIGSPGKDYQEMEEEIKKYKGKLFSAFNLGDIIHIDSGESQLAIPSGKVFMTKIAKIVTVNQATMTLKCRFLNPYKDLKPLPSITLDASEITKIISKKELGEVKSDSAILSYIQLNNLLKSIKTKEK